MEPLTRHRLLIFCLATALFSWPLAGVIAWFELGGLSATLVAVVYMWGPTVGNLLARALTGEGKSDLGLNPEFAARWRWWLAAWLLPAVLIAIGTIAYFALFPGRFSDELAAFVAAGETGLSARQLLATQLAVGLLLGPIINVIGTFGEEFGWRGYLQPKLLPLGTRRALLITGAIWGIWHAPLIMLGHNYGLDDPGAPWSGIAMMTLFCMSAGVVIGWLTIRGGSVWPAVIAHGSLNALGAVGLLFLAGGGTADLLGPHPAGLVGMSGFLLLALLLLLRPAQLEVRAT